MAELDAAEVGARDAVDGLTDRVDVARAAYANHSATKHKRTNRTST